MKTYSVIIALVILSIATTSAYRFIKGDWVLYRKAGKYLEQRSYSKAAAILDGLAKKGFQEKNTLSLLGESYEKAGDLQNAVEALKRLAKIEPGDKWIYLRLAELYDKKGDHTRAADIYNSLLKKEPGNRSIQARLARSLVSAGDFDAAINQYRTILGEGQ